MLDLTAKKPLIDIRQVSRSFPKGSGKDVTVLENVDLTIREGELVGLLGRSGSGKSTLLRIIAGLVEPSSGVAQCRGAEIDGPPTGIALVFQSFALFPWLTVLQNVELGLEAQGVSLRDVAQALVRNSPYIRPGTDGGDDDAALNDDVPQDRWAGLRTRDDMRDEVNAGRPTDSQRA